MSWPEDRRECEWVVCKLCTPPISIIGLKPLRLVGIVPAAGLAQGTAPAAEVPAGTVRVRGTGRPWAGRGTGPVGIGRLGAVLWVPGTGRVRGTDPVAGIGRPWAGRGIGRFGAGPSCGCS